MREVVFSRLIIAVASAFFLAMMGTCVHCDAQAADGSDRPQIRATRIDGEVIVGSIESIDRAGVVNFSDNAQSVALGDLAVIEVANATSQTKRSSLDRTQLLLLRGGFLTASEPVLESGQFQFQSATGLSSLPAEIVRGVIWKDSDVVQDALGNPSSEQDSVIVDSKNSIRGVQGILEQITNQAVQLNFKGQSRKIGLDKVHAVVMADLGLAAASGTEVELNLIDGSRILGVLEAWKKNEIVVGLSRRVSVSVPAHALLKLSIKSDRLVYLSDVEPTAAQQRATFTVERPWQRDRSVTGSTLKVYDFERRLTQSFAKGLGTSSWSRLVFENDGDYDRFACVAGIDVDAAGRGNCRMVVRGDGIKLWSGDVSGQSSAIPVDVDIRGMQQIELEVQPGKDFDLADHANWCDARFLKTH